MTNKLANITLATSMAVGAFGIVAPTPADAGTTLHTTVQSMCEKGKVNDPIELKGWFGIKISRTSTRCCNKSFTNSARNEGHRVIARGSKITKIVRTSCDNDNDGGGSTSSSNDSSGGGSLGGGPSAGPSSSLN